jgi:CBS domain-containing protein
VNEHQRVLLPRMLESTLRHKVLIGVLGNLLTERYGADSGGIDVKYGIYIPMVNGIRLLALREGVEATSTLERIRQLKQRGAIRSSTADDWEFAFLNVLTFRSMVPTQEANGFYNNRGKLPAKLLTKEVKKELKRTLRIGADLQKHVKRAFGSEGRL